MIALPALEGVEHRHVDVAEGVRIHVADAGPADGPAVMLVHGFPQNWWEWRDLIGPLAADGKPGAVSRPARRGLEFGAPLAVYQDRDG